MSTNSETRPAASFAAVTKSDTDNFTTQCRALYIGVGGDVVVLAPDGTLATFKNVASGSILPVKAKRVNSTSTTATDIVALF